MTITKRDLQALNRDIKALGKKYIRRSPVNGEKRAPFCFMGVCYECLMEIDGILDQQACIIEVRDSMNIKLQTGLPKVLNPDKPELNIDD